MRSAGVAVLCGVLAGAIAAHAAEQEPFRSGVDLVALNVVVTDGHQKPVTGLTQDQFVVFEDGVQQDVSFFAANRVPLDLALLLDTSASMSDKMKTLQKAALGVLSTLKADDRVSIVDIKATVKVLHPLDGDVAAARRAVEEAQARGGTALYNGLYMTMKEMMRRRPTNGEIRRQAIAVLSDGDDTASLVTFDDVLDVAKRSGIALYTVALLSESDTHDTKSSGTLSIAEYSMKALAQETGARSFFPGDVSELVGIYGTIAAELASQYVLGYTSKNPKRDRTFRRISVQVTDLVGVRTRARSGYVSPAPDRVARH